MKQVIENEALNHIANLIEAFDDLEEGIKLYVPSYNKWPLATQVLEDARAYLKEQQAKREQG
jgi:hypothetical protein